MTIDDNIPLGVEDVLVSGVDDWVDASCVTTLLADRFDNPEKLQRSAMALVSQVVRDGLMTPGDLIEGRFVPWATPTVNAIERIRRDWLSDPDPEFPRPGAVVWLENTARGDRLARSIEDGSNSV